MTSRLRATTAVLLILWIGWFARSAEATDLKNTIRNLYGIQGIHVEPSPFFPVETSFQASSLQGLDGLNSQLTSAIGVPSFNSSVTGFTFDIERGIPVRTTESLGPMLTERATTMGISKLNVAGTYTRVSFTRLDGKNLNNLQLTFHRNDVNEGCDPSIPQSLARCDTIRARLKVDLSEDIFAFIATYGLTSVWDVGLVVPLTHIRLFAKASAGIFHVDTLGVTKPGTTQIGNLPIHQFGPNSTPPDASGGGEETGLGDIILRTKYNFLRNSGGLTPDLAFLFEVKLPTGDAKRLLGTGGTNLAGLLIASKTYGRWLTPHVNVGYEINTKELEQNTIRYALGFDARLLSGLSFDADVIGRQKPEGNGTGDHTVDLSLGVKWNPLNSLIFRANVQIPLDKNSGLRADFIPTIGVEYLF